MASNLIVSINDKDYVVRVTSIERLITHLEDEAEGSAARALRIILAASIADELGGRVDILHGEQTALRKALRDLQQSGDLPTDLTPLLYA